MISWTNDNDPDGTVRASISALRDAYHNSPLPPSNEAKRRIAAAILTLDYGIDDRHYGGGGPRPTGSLP